MDNPIVPKKVTGIRSSGKLKTQCTLIASGDAIDARICKNVA